MLVKDAVGGEVIVFGSVVEGKHTMASDIYFVVFNSIESVEKILMKRDFGRISSFPNSSRNEKGV